MFRAGHKLLDRKYTYLSSASKVSADAVRRFPRFQNQRLAKFGRDVWRGAGNLGLGGVH